MDKGDVVRDAATVATKAILKLFPPESVRVVFKTLEDILETGKWRTKVGALDAMKNFVNSARDAVAAEIGSILPKVEGAMHDTKSEVRSLDLYDDHFLRHSVQVSSAANKCATALCTTLANPDLSPHIPSLVKCMSNPDSVPACIKSLSSTTFVAEVTAPALAVLVPLLLRALNDRSMEVQRRTVVVVENLVKLVRDPNIAATYLNPLVDGVEKIAKGAAFPEVRAFAESCLNVMLKAGASKDGPPPPKRDLDAEKSEVLTSLLTLLPCELSVPPATNLNGPHSPRHPLLAQNLDFAATLAADLVYARKFSDADAWTRCVGTYVALWMKEDLDDSKNFAESVRQHFLAIDKVCTLPSLSVVYFLSTC